MCLSFTICHLSLTSVCFNLSFFVTLPNDRDLAVPFFCNPAVRFMSLSFFEDLLFDPWERRLSFFSYRAKQENSVKTSIQKSTLKAMLLNSEMSKYYTITPN